MKSWSEQIVIFAWVGLVILIGNSITTKAPIYESTIGILILIAFTIIGLLLEKLIPVKLPAVFWISTVALLATCPITPFGHYISTQFLSKINMLCIATPILAYAGLALGKDLKLFKTLSWRIVVVALTVYTGTFLFATTIAEFVLRATGQV